MRAAKRVGNDRVAIVKACSAAMTKSSKGGALLNAVPAEARGDLGYALCRITWLLRNDTPGSNIRGRIVTPKNDLGAAAKLALAGTPEDLRRQDTDEWWRARRALARKLIDVGDAATAYQVARTAAPPANPYYEADVHFMAGWIALRFLNDPAAAREHFAEVDAGKLALAFVTDLAAESSDPAVISGIGKLAGRYKDAQAMLIVGKTALGRGLP